MDPAETAYQFYIDYYIHMKYTGLRTEKWSPLFIQCRNYQNAVFLYIPATEMQEQKLKWQMLKM
jgi:hypothetical protein